MKHCIPLLLVLCLLLSLRGAALADTVLQLPSALKSIEEDAFRGDASLDEVVLPEGIESLGGGAFAESSLTKINLPDSLTEIADDALPAPGTVTVTANEGTDAYDWAVDKGYIVPEGSVAISAANFPDETFRGYVSDSFDEDGDGCLSAAELAEITEIDVHQMGITSLDGIQFFPALETLNCIDNQLTSLVVKQNRRLKTLLCSYNQLEALDVSALSELEWLAFASNRVSEIDLTQNPKLSRLVCWGNRLTVLNVSRNLSMTFLHCGENQLHSLYLGQNTVLSSVYCYLNNLTALDVSQNPALSVLSCFNNSLGSLNVRQNPSLQELYCYNNSLSALDLSLNPSLSFLNCAGNTGIATLDISACPVLAAAAEGEARTDYPGDELMPQNTVFYSGEGDVVVFAVDPGTTVVTEAA